MTPPTPFDAYFAARIAPALAGAPPDAVKLARAAAVDIWNAALDAAIKKADLVEDGPDDDPEDHIALGSITCRDLEELRVTP